MKKYGAKLLKVIGERSDIAVAMLLVLVIFMMILPIPTVIVDLFIAANIAGAVIILMLGVYIQSPLEFSTFPSVLLLSTLFRLALSITTTRLILLDAEAGAIIQTFGEFVVGGNLIVGLVIFLIITIVQFIVITKGAERIAEVSARFTLDAMPGKQMSVDSDLRAGIISSVEARKKRKNIEKESQLFGSMDGAMKFVKGDAIAGILITVINLLGGISIGVLQNDMSFADATELFSVLTIGDGLVAQIPALIIAISSGIIVTRISDEEPTNLGQDIGRQITNQPRALLIAGVVLLGFALIPGFPTMVIISLSALLLLGGYYKNLQQKKISESSLAQKIPALARAGHSPVGFESDGKPKSFSHAPVIVQLSEKLRSKLLIDDLTIEMDNVRSHIEKGYGIPFPGVEIAFDQSLSKNYFNIEINGYIEFSGQLEIEKIIVPADIERLNDHAVSYSEPKMIAPNLSIVEIEPQNIQSVIDQGIIVLTPSIILGKLITYVLLKNASNFIGIQETHYILQQYEHHLGELSNEAQRVMPIPKIAAVFRKLVSEKVPITDIRSILETIAQHGESVPDPVDLSEYVRIALKKQICAPLIDRSMQMRVILIEPAREEQMKDALRQTPNGVFLKLEPSYESEFITKISNLLSTLDYQAIVALITSSATRQGLSNFLMPKNLNVVVLSDKELNDDIKLNILGKI